MNECTDREAGPEPSSPKVPKRRATEVDVLVGLRLRDARLLAGFSQHQLGRAMGISFQAVQKYENGENRLAVGRLSRAATLLGQPVSFFFSEQPIGAAAPSANLSAQEAEFVRHFRNIEDPEIRANLLRLVREMDQSRLRLEK